MLLGAHVSIAGGYMNALVEAKRLKMEAIQIFTRDQRMWREKLVMEDEGKEFRESLKKYGVKQAFSHAIYLISLASADEDIVEKSVLSLAAELERSRSLGLTHTVMHPGSAKAFPFQEALTRVGDNIKRVLKTLAKNPVKILLENTASGSLGNKIEHQQVDQEVAPDKPLCFHLNDSKGGLGSRIDRHANIGEGQVGLLPFEYIMKNFPHIPKLIEAPKEYDADKTNLELLRKLFKTK